MKAVTYTHYGNPDVLRLNEVEKPSPGKNEVLIKIYSTAINDYDWSMVRGKPEIYRLMYGLFKPKHLIPGMELSGTVEAIGDEVTSFKVGEAVYGDTSDCGFGTFAEYMSVKESSLIRKPDDMSFEEAASLSHASMLAYQALFDIANIREGQQVLINGAGGGVGSFALQMAKMYNSEVTGVDTGEKLSMMERIGFDHIIDYKREDFTKSGKRYDVIVDCKTSRSPFVHARSLHDGGIYVTVGGHLGYLLETLLWAPLIRKRQNKTCKIVALKPNKDLQTINEWYEAGKIQCQLDGPYPLEKLPWALQYFGEGKHQGKVIINI